MVRRTLLSSLMAGVLLGCNLFSPAPTPVTPPTDLPTAAATLRPTETATPVPTPSPTPLPVVEDVAGLACQGKPVPGAAAYGADLQGVAKIFIANAAGNAHAWNAELPVGLRATGVDSLAVVVCLEDQQPVEDTVKNCGMYSTSRLGSAPKMVSLGLGVYEQQARLVAASSGETLSEALLQGQAVPTCPAQISSSDPNIIDSVLYGEAVQLETLLAEVLPVAAPQSAPVTVGTSELGGGLVAVSPDGGLMAVEYDGDFGVQVWDTQTRTKRFTLLGHSDTVVELAFSPDGLWLATGSSNGEVLLWDLAQGEMRYRLGDETKPVQQVLFSPDGKRLVTSVQTDTSLYVWNVESGQLEKRLTSVHDYVRRLAFSPDGKRLAALLDKADASGYQRMTVRSWELAGGTWAYQGERGESYWEIFFTPDGESVGLLVIDGPTQFHLLGLAPGSGKVISKTLPWELTRKAAPGLVSFAPNPGWLVFTNFNGSTILVFDLKQERFLAELAFPDGQSNSFLTFAFTPDGKYLAVYSNGGDLYLWDLRWLGEDW